MPGGKTNTDKIEMLENQAANILRRLDVSDTIIQYLKADLAKCEEITAVHVSKLTIVDHVNLKFLQAAIVQIEKDHVSFKKDLETLQKWKDELKKEREESTRRWWSFGPNISAAIIGGIIALIVAGLNMAFNIYLHKQ
jgi:hypothetical protein